MTVAEVRPGSPEPTLRQEPSEISLALPRTFFSLILMAVGCRDWRPAVADRKEGCNSLPGAAAPTGAVA